MKKKAKPIVGYSDVSTVKLDFDNKPFRVVRYWAKRICRFFKLKGFVILKSSPDHYHVVFDRSVSWAENVHILCWTALMLEGRQLQFLPATGFAIMQCIKESSCVRVGKKRNKPSPRIVCGFGKRNCEIRNYVNFRKRFTKEVKR